MREAAKLTAFILLVIGTIGLLVNEFVADWGRGVTITFACLNVLGLVVLTLTTWTMGKRKADWYSQNGRRKRRQSSLS
jgi:hypothetical protein